MQIDYNVLQSEILMDPLGLGYDQFISVGNDGGVASLLNALTGPGIGDVPADPITSEAFIASISADELANLSSLQLMQVQIITSSPKVDIGSQTIQDWVGLTWPQAATNLSLASPVTNTALTSMSTRTGSRAEVLFGPNIIFNGNDVSYALRGTGTPSYTPSSTLVLPVPPMPAPAQSLPPV